MGNETQFANWSHVRLFILMGLVLILMVGVLAVINDRAYENHFMPEIVLPMVMIGGVILLLVAFAILAAIFSAVGLSSKDNALGLPEGSVRAVIAVGLILIFAITSVFLFFQMSEPDLSNEMRLTADQYAQLNPEQIYSSIQEGDTYRVKTVITKSEASEDFAQQLLSTISTLVVAVAGFYFGAKAVTAARGAEGLPTIMLLSPTDRATVKPGGSLLIRLSSDPGGLQITGRIEGDTGGKLEPIRYDEFQYTAGAEASGEVKLYFSLAAHPGIAPIELPVTIEKVETGDPTN